MSDIEIKNARIESTFLGTDSGHFTCYLRMKSDMTVQSFGGYLLDELHNFGTQRVRIGSAFGMEFIRSILKTLQIEKWEDLAGTYCRIKANRSIIHAIGHITEDKWFEPKKDLADMRSGDEKK